MVPLFVTRKLADDVAYSGKRTKDYSDSAQDGPVQEVIGKRAQDETGENVTGQCGYQSEIFDAGSGHFTIRTQSSV